jgi:hypothetical protein
LFLLHHKACNIRLICNGGFILCRLQGNQTVAPLIKTPAALLTVCN